MLAMMQRAEQRHDYEADLDVPKEMVADEKIHSEVVRGLAARQRATISGSFRAAVFGVNDGLVSTCALILGIFGTGVSKTTIIATGLAGLLSGALSMGAGSTFRYAPKLNFWLLLHPTLSPSTPSIN